MEGAPEKAGREGERKTGKIGRGAGGGCGAALRS
jgi:hypothetical protein